MTSANHYAVLAALTFDAGTDIRVASRRALATLDTWREADDAAAVALDVLSARHDPPHVRTARATLAVDRAMRRADTALAALGLSDATGE